jgi:hypothetical protein
MAMNTTIKIIHREFVLWERLLESFVSYVLVKKFEGIESTEILTSNIACT